MSTIPSRSSRRTAPARQLAVLAILIAGSLSLETSPRPASAAPAIQEAEGATIYLPLNLRGATRTSLRPERTPVPPTSEPSATATAPAQPTLPPTAQPSPTPTAKPLPPIEIDGDWVRTPHYALFVPVPEIDKRDLGLMMEQFYEQATAYFGAEPEGQDRLVGKIYADNASYRAGLRADGIPGSAGGSGGYYHPSNRTFYLFQQPSRHYSRMLTMHEAGHQLQHLAGGCRNPGWWTEGEAEHLGMHSWDGETLHMARQPLISLEDHPASALASWEQKDRDFGYMVEGGSGWSYREAWGVISFLRDESPAAFQDLRGRYCEGESSAAAWEAVFGGPVDAEMNARYGAWLEANQQAWDWIWNAFEPWGHSGFEGAAEGSNALAVMKRRPELLRAEIEPVSGDLRAGIVVAYHSTEDFVMLRLYADRRLEVIRVSQGFRWDWLRQTSASDPPDGQPDRMEARVLDGKLQLSVNGQAVYELEDDRDLAGRFGLNLESCAIRAKVWTEP